MTYSCLFCSVPQGSVLGPRLLFYTCMTLLTKCNNMVSKTVNFHAYADDSQLYSRLLGVLISPDLTFDQHVTIVSGHCFYQLHELCSVRQSFYTESITTLIRAFVSSRVDYCCSLLIGSPRSVTDKLQRVLNAAARVITNSSKYDSGLSRTLHHEQKFCSWE